MYFCLRIEWPGEGKDCTHYIVSYTVPCNSSQKLGEVRETSLWVDDLIVLVEVTAAAGDGLAAGCGGKALNAFAQLDETLLDAEEKVDNRRGRNQEIAEDGPNADQLREEGKNHADGDHEDGDAGPHQACPGLPLRNGGSRPAGALS